MNATEKLIWDYRENGQSKKAAKLESIKDDFLQVDFALSQDLPDWSKDKIDEASLQVAIALNEG